jgi:two-component system chemotaxis response regulator CheB
VTPPVCVVGIGASAGEVSALPIVLSALPANFPATILVVLHMGPRGPSYLARMLARDCRLPVRYAVDGEALEPATVFVAPPGAHLS